jgi:hypothetical protein
MGIHNKIQVKIAWMVQLHPKVHRTIQRGEKIVLNHPLPVDPKMRRVEIEGSVLLDH